MIGDGMTVYLCPVCGTTLLVVSRPAVAGDAVVQASSLAEIIRLTVERGMVEHYALVDGRLRVAVMEHDCPRRWRWRLWQLRHRRELAAS